jgi:hypothetical protein
MSKRQLKEKYKNLEINLIDIVSKFDPSKTGKYTKFLTDFLIKKVFDNESKNIRIRGRLRSKNFTLRDSLLEKFSIPFGSNELENVIIDYLTDVFGSENIENLYLFNYHLDNNRIQNGYRDITEYSSWDEINKQVSMATINYEKKRLEKDVLISFENKEWLVIRPLTIESSLVYGSATKWCTASRNNHEYFYRYSNNGVLYYVMNKLNGNKYGIYYDKQNSEFSIWDSIDKRLDSIECSIPHEIVRELYVKAKTDVVNYEYFSDSEKKESKKFYESFDETPQVEEIGEGYYVNETEYELPL